MGKVAFPLHNVRKDVLNNWHLEQITEEITVSESQDQYGYYTASLVEVPAASTGTSVLIAGLQEYKSIPVDIKTGELVLPTNQFYVNYNTGEILFHASKAGSTFTVTYYGKGSLVEAEDVNDVNERTEAIESTIETIQPTLDEFRVAVDANTAAVSAMGETIDLIQANIGTMEEEVAGVKTSMDDKADVSYVEAEINGTKDLIVSYVSEGGEVDRLVDAKLVSYVSEADYSADQAEREAAYDAKYIQSSTVVDLESDVAENTANIASNLEKINANTLSIQSLQDSVSQLDSSKAEKTAVDANTSSISELSGSIESLASVAAENQNNISALTASLAETNQNVESVSSKVETIESEYITADALAPLATKAELENYATAESLEPLATRQEVADGYVPVSALSELATKSEISDMATKTELGGYATKEDISDMATGADLESYARKEDLSDYAAVSSLDNYATKEDISDFVTHGDMSSYVSIEVLDNYAEKSDLLDYATKSELDGYATVSSLDNFATKSEISEKVDRSELELYATKSELDGYATLSALDDYAAKSELAGYVEVSALNDLATKAEIADMATKTELADYAPVSMLENYATVGDLGNYVPVSSLDELATKQEVQEGYVPVSDLDILATKQEVADGYIPVDTLNDLSTKSELDDVNSQLEANYERASIKLASLERQIEKLSRGNIENKASTADASFNDSSVDLVLSADELVTANSEIVANSVEIQSLNVDSSRISMTSSGLVSVNNYESTGSYPRNASNGNAQVIVKTGDYVEIKNSVFGMTEGYNCIEIGLNGDVPKGVLIENCNFNRPLSNNAILVFGHQDEAVIEIKNCVFASVSNALRISNRTNTKGTFIFRDCVFNVWESDPSYAGPVLCQDYTNTTSEEYVSANLFAPEKIKIEFVNCTGPDGNKIDGGSDPAEYSGSGDADKQLVYVYGMNAVLPYSASRYPRVVFE